MKMKNNPKLQAMKHLIYSLIGIAFAVSLAYCSNDMAQERTSESVPIEKEYDAGIEDDIITHELEKENLLEKEQTNPNEYLELDAKTNKNLTGNWILKGSIKNTAQEATYNNILLEVKFYDKSDSLILTSEERLNSTIAPKQTIDLKYQLTQKPSGVKRAEVTISL
jgi:hypothetical protein